MGACVSTWMILESDHNIHLPTSSSAANVITLTGQLRQFPLPITVSQLVIQLESSPSSFFISNSDYLHYDHHIPALHSTHQLQPGQIYFILPNSMLNHPLNASAMAALAVKASHAISSASNSRKSETLSILSESQEDMNMNMMTRENKKSRGGALGISRSGSMGKLQRYSTSRRPKVAATRSFQRLTIIHEASADLQAY